MSYGNFVSLQLKALLVIALVALCFNAPARAEPLPRDTIAAMIVPPMTLGEQVNDNGVWQLALLVITYVPWLSLFLVELLY